MSLFVTPERELSISEIFGPTIQGEGPSQGRCVVFLRLGLCNLDCSWCDTPYTWDWTGKNGVKYDKDTELKRLTVSNIYDQLDNLCSTLTDRVVISGGEPLLQQSSLVVLIDKLFANGITTEIETNGTVLLSDEMLTLDHIGAVSFNCSPKLANSGVSLDKRIKSDALNTLRQASTVFKFVVSTDADIKEIDDLLTTTLHGVPTQNVYIMPEGTTQNKIGSRLGWAFNIASQRGWSLSPRLHVLAFNDKRGI